jgi:phosphatidylinositol alpha-mannosyltransferase
MRIGICAPYDLARDGGVNSHIRAQAHALRRLGHTVRIFGAASAPLAAGEQAISGCLSAVIGETETAVGFDPRAWARVGALYRHEQFDLVHVHEPLMPLVPWCAVRRARVPIVGTFHTHREDGHRFYAASRCLLAPLMRRLALRIAVSEAAHRTTARYFPGDYVVIPNGIDVDRFRGGGRRPASMADGRLHVLVVGRLEPRKGIEHLIDAMALVARQEPSARLVLVGDGPSGDRLRRRAEAAHLDAVFTGRVGDADLASYYRAADVVAAPATGGESFGIVLLEALAAGRPVVATDIDGFRALVAGTGDHVRLVPPANPPALADAIVALLRNPDRRPPAPAAGPIFADRFDWMTVARALDRHYRALVGGVAASAPGSVFP